MSKTDKSDWHDIEIKSPIPMGVAGAVMQLIGAAWPEAVIVSSNSSALHMKVPPKGAKQISKAKAAKIADEAAETQSDLGDSDFLGFCDGYVSVTPPEELQKHLGLIAHEIMSHYKDAVNYLEWEIRTPEGDRYVLAVGRSKGQLPHAMRMKAESKLSAANAQLARLKEVLEDHHRTVSDPTQARDIADMDLIDTLDELLRPSLTHHEVIQNRSKGTA